MKRILLADTSPHAQRMGESILREEGFEVVTITDGDTVLLRLQDVKPDLIMADVMMPSRSGYQICEFVKGSGRYGHTPLILTAGARSPVDEEEARRVKADATLNKPFEASLLLDTVRRLLQTAQPRPEGQEKTAEGPRQSGVALVDPERVRAAVTLALDAAMAGMIEHVTEKVLIALAPTPR